MGTVKSETLLQDSISSTYNKCVGHCCCCSCFNPVKNISVNNGITTITLNNDVLSDLKSMQKFCIGLCVNIPNMASGSKIQVTDGNKTMFIYLKCHCIKYWKPTKLVYGSVITLSYLNDETLILQRVFC